MRRTRITIIMAVVLALGLGAMSAQAAERNNKPATQDAGVGRNSPGGNNGTVKIDGTEFTNHPNNEPHVGCVFQVDFYGYDQGALYWADVTFEAHPPTGPRQVLDTQPRQVFIGEDGAGGGVDVDAQQTYDLGPALIAAGIDPHPKQGFHVKLTVNAPNSRGADVKHKVFWVEGCAPGTGTPGGGGSAGH